MKIPLAYGRAGIENLIKLLSEEISEPALVNTLSLIRDEMKCQETKTRSIELNLVRILGRGLRRDWMISEYLSDEEARDLIRARSLTLDILGDVSTISYGREEMKSQNIMLLVVKELTSKHPIILASATRALSRCHTVNRFLITLDNTIILLWTIIWILLASNLNRIQELRPLVV